MKRGPRRPPAPHLDNPIRTYEQHCAAKAEAGSWSPTAWYRGFVAEAKLALARKPKLRMGGGR